MRKLTAILLGGGSRGKVYTDFALSHPDMLELKAVAEPIEKKRNYFKRMHHLEESVCYTDWRKALARPKFADIAIISTMDRDHYAPAMKAIELGYDLLLEKPIAPTPQECKDIAEAAEKKGVSVIVCHVLRFTEYFTKIKDIIDSGKLGKIMSVSHIEEVGNTHYSHSFVRGNWGNSDLATPMLLQKSCHDFDILLWMTGKQYQKIQSFGSLDYFTKENKPEGAPARCTDGCPHAETCPYNAEKLYQPDGNWFLNAACGTHEDHVTPEEIRDTLENGRFGKCVFDTNNNVVDHQTVNFTFTDGATGTFTMCAFTKSGRKTRIMGTKGELWGNDDQDFLNFFNFQTHEVEKIMVRDGKLEDKLGHGGGDTGIMHALCAYLNGEYTGKSICDISESCLSHYAVFAAEEARENGTIIDVPTFTANI